LQKNAGKSALEAHEKTRKQTNASFFADISEVIEKFGSSDREKSILFIDKNHSIEGLASTLRPIDQAKLPEDTVIKKVGVIPVLSKEL